MARRSGSCLLYTSKKGILSRVDLEKTMDREEYRKKLDQLQKRLERLHGDLYRYRIPVVLGFEGWDAAGKGGAIRRLTSHLDPRGSVSYTHLPRRMWS